MSKTTIQMQRRGQRLECVSPVWADLLEEFPQGVDLNVAITRARSLRQNGTYFGTLAWLISDGPERFAKTWLTKDELSDALQLEVGFVRQKLTEWTGYDAVAAYLEHMACRRKAA
jgi:hypothetical protein